MKLEELLTGLQGFCLGAIAMAYVADYNRGQLSAALICLVVGIIFRVIRKYS